ncbi:MAG: hypothetical protein NUV88_03250, partial [Candidatus Kaiserbacteria bacterium]|nr:hypothetical protein [Candidatus Kaiserbacteria bacterium]
MRTITLSIATLISLASLFLFPFVVNAQFDNSGAVNQQLTNGNLTPGIQGVAMPPAATAVSAAE